MNNIKTYTTAEAITESAWEVGAILGKEVPGIFISICELAVVALFIELLKLIHPDPKSVVAQHFQKRAS